MTTTPDSPHQFARSPVRTVRWVKHEQVVAVQGGASASVHNIGRLHRASRLDGIDRVPNPVLTRLVTKTSISCGTAGSDPALARSRPASAVLGLWYQLKQLDPTSGGSAEWVRGRCLLRHAGLSLRGRAHSLQVERYLPAKGSFTGLFCINGRGVGAYTQGSVSGTGWITVCHGITSISAVGRNLALAGSTNGRRSGFVEFAPAPFKVGTFTLN